MSSSTEMKAAAGPRSADDTVSPFQLSLLLALGGCSRWELGDGHLVVRTEMGCAAAFEEEDDVGDRHGLGLDDDGDHSVCAWKFSETGHHAFHLHPATGSAEGGEKEGKNEKRGKRGGGGGGGGGGGRRGGGSSTGAEDACTVLSAAAAAAGEDGKNAGGTTPDDTPDSGDTPIRRAAAASAASAAPRSKTGHTEVLWWPERSPLYFVLPSDAGRRAQCDAIYHAVEAHAAVHGWSTDRHDAHPTTDAALGSFPLPTIRDPCMAIITECVAPFLCYKFGLPSGSLVAHDMFIVKYSEEGQRELGMHQDHSHFSFNVLLSPEGGFEGGGTYFEEMDETVTVAQGEGVVHMGSARHRGVAITAGVRMILVGFLQDKRWDAKTMRHWERG
jgi:hypothetical protein